MKVLVTGSAGFIGNNLSEKLLNRGDEVIGIDNLNDYYDVTLKEARLDKIIIHNNFTEARINLEIEMLLLMYSKPTNQIVLLT